MVLHGQQTAVELKYKTRRVDCEFAGERFSLRNQGAQDQGRYDFCWDISRVEMIRSSHPATHGVAVFLTNDRSYWEPKRSSTSVDSAFRLCDGISLDGVLEWLPHTSEGTKRGRDKRIELRHSYHLRWQEYSNLSVDKHGEFRFLPLTAAGPAGAPPLPNHGGLTCDRSC